jgi:hypothetical protein
LGFDTDEAPKDLVARLTSLSSEVGIDAISEVAPACGVSEPEAILESIVEVAKSEGVVGRLPGGELDSHGVSYGRPWDRGHGLARKARKVWGLGGGRLPDSKFAEVLGVPELTLKTANGETRDLPMGLGIREGNKGKYRLVFRRNAHNGRRFEAARFLADNIVAPSEDRWLPSTDAKTARQKTQRAFAAEFLCPIDALVDYLKSDFSSEAVEEAGEFFGVSPLAVRSHLANNGYIHPLEVFG